MKAALSKLDLPLVDLYLFNHYGEFLAAFAGNSDGYFTKEKLTQLAFTTVDQKNITGEHVVTVDVQVTEKITWKLVATARNGFGAGLSTVIPIVVVVLTTLVLILDEIAVLLIRKKHLLHQNSREVYNQDKNVCILIR